MTAAMQIIDIADRLTAAFAAKDIQAIAALYADDMSVWHNYDRKIKSKSVNLEMIGGFFASFDKVAYTRIKRQYSDGGFTQEHIVVAQKNDGTVVGELPCCIVVSVANDQIQWISEYIDSVQIASLFPSNG
jgi:ketosteroid isomerase-like protein